MHILSYSPVFKHLCKSLFPAQHVPLWRLKSAPTDFHVFLFPLNATIWKSTSDTLLSASGFSQTPCSPVPSIFLQVTGLHSFYGWIKSFCLYMPHFLHPLVDDGPSGWIHSLVTGSCEDKHVYWQISCMLTLMPYS